MANEVYANDREVSCKAGNNKVIAAFPDVCLSPPSPPAGPIPIPYPVSSSSADTTDGSKTVKISGQEVMLKDKSYYKKCTGDEAATKSFGQGVINHALSGKVYFVSWSMDVLIEGENVVRHLDMTTSNHASPMANQPLPIPGLDKLDPAVKRDCEATYQKYKLHRHGSGSCTDLMGETGHQSHHPAMNACFDAPGARGTAAVPGYNTLDAPGVCLQTDGPDSPHKRVNAAQRTWKKGLTKAPTRSEVRKAGKEQLINQGGMSDPEAECIMKAVDAYLDHINVTEATPLQKPS